jgi:hypothetical protein
MLIYCILLNTVIATLVSTFFYCIFVRRKKVEGLHAILNSLKIQNHISMLQKILKNMYPVNDLYYNHVKYQYEKIVF